MSGSDGRSGQFSYLGITYGLADLLQQHHVSNETPVVLQFNFDGLPLYKSSSIELWPIPCLGKNISNTPFVVGLYCGAKKPHSLADYLHDFIDELQVLLVEGVACNNVHYAIQI